MTRTIAAAPQSGTTLESTPEDVIPTTTTEVVTVIESVITQLPIEQITAQRIGGQKVPTEKIAALFRQPTVVIMLRAGQQLDSKCAKLFKPDVLVVHLSNSGTPQTVGPGIRPLRVSPPPLVPR